MGLLNDGWTVLKEKGVMQFLSRSIGFAYRHTIRPYLPTTGYYKDNQVKITERKMLDCIFHTPFSNNPDFEGGIVSSHNAVTRPGDSVIIVGGGNGVTAVRAAKKVGEHGSVMVFEGGKESVTKIKKVLSMNNVYNLCSVSYTIVGQEKDVYGGDTNNANRIHPKKLDECDVLELDCEGSEIDILTNLSISPRAIIVELHPHKYKEHPEKPIELLSGMGYETKLKFGHSGIPITDEEFTTLTSNRIKWGESPLQSNAQAPVVIVATRQ